MEGDCGRRIGEDRTGEDRIGQDDGERPSREHEKTPPALCTCFAQHIAPEGKLCSHPTRFRALSDRRGKKHQSIKRSATWLSSPSEHQLAVLPRMTNYSPQRYNIGDGMDDCHTTPASIIMLPVPRLTRWGKKLHMSDA